MRSIPKMLDQKDYSRRISLTTAARTEPYQSQFIPVTLKEKPGETLLVHSQPRMNPNSLPFPTEVDENNAIHLTFMNNTRGIKEVTQGTMLGTFEILHFESVNTIQTQSEHHSLEFENDLLPKNDRVKTQENKVDQSDSLN